MPRPSGGTRPTTDRVRESLFNIVTARLDLAGLAVLDLYAGSGALGLEALSRGAASALFVESDRRSGRRHRAQHRGARGLTGATLRWGSGGAVLGAGRSARWIWCSPTRRTTSPLADVDAVLAALGDARLGGGGQRRGGGACGVGAPLTWPAGGRCGRERRYGDTRLELAELTDRVRHRP